MVDSREMMGGWMPGIESIDLAWRPFGGNPIPWLAPAEYSYPAPARAPLTPDPLTPVHFPPAPP